MRLVVLLPALAALLAGCEGRVVFPAFGEYIRLHPPFNYIAVTAALYGVTFLVFLHVAGLLSSEAVETKPFKLFCAIGEYMRLHPPFN